MARLQDTRLIYKNQLLGYVAAVNKGDLKLKNNAIYINTAENEIGINLTKYVHDLHD